MTTDTFIKIGDIKGESRDRYHKDEIEVLSWGWGLSIPAGASSAGGGARPGKANFQDLSFTHLVDMASPKLMLACASGKHYPEAKLSVCRPGPKASVDFILISMREVLVTGVQSTGAHGQEGPAEQVTLNFAQVDFEYVAQKPDGSPDAGVHFRWDLKKNTAI
jgi:type VI secretion system secreted protein Hcp